MGHTAVMHPEDSGDPSQAFSLLVHFYSLLLGFFRKMTLGFENAIGTASLAVIFLLAIASFKKRHYPSLLSFSRKRDAELPANLMDSESPLRFAQNDKMGSSFITTPLPSLRTCLSSKRPCSRPRQGMSSNSTSYAPSFGDVGTSAGSGP